MKHDGKGGGLVVTRPGLNCGVVERALDLELDDLDSNPALAMQYHCDFQVIPTLRVSVSYLSDEERGQWENALTSRILQSLASV